MALPGFERRRLHQDQVVAVDGYGAVGIPQALGDLVGLAASDAGQVLAAVAGDATSYFAAVGIEHVDDLLADLERALG